MAQRDERSPPGKRRVDRLKKNAGAWGAAGEPRFSFSWPPAAVPRFAWIAAIAAASTLVLTDFYFLIRDMSRIQDLAIEFLRLLLTLAGG